MELAFVVAKRATCPRLSVGAVIVRDKRILSTGYNGAVTGADHCIDVGCEVVNGHCIRSIHAEVNAILHAAKNGVAIDGSDIYVTVDPCHNCLKLLAQAGIKRIVHRDTYGIKNYNKMSDVLGSLMPEVIRLK